MPALAEEPGWRGFALPQLQSSYGPLLGSLILGALHMSWHLPVFFIHDGIMAMAPFKPGDFAYQILTSMVITVIWAWVFNNARGSIFMAMVLHGTNNGVGALASGWGAQFSAPNVGTLGDMLFAACALLIVACTRGRLSYTPGLALPAAEAAISAEQPAPKAG
jgi:membrane protease YdiL (CAAX protease family)